MTPRSWIRRLFARTSRTSPITASRRRRTARLELEQLEGRVVPSLAVLTVTDAQDDYTPTLANHFMNTATGQMSLRGAILAANAHEGNSIAFSVPTVTVTSSLPKATVALTIDGSGGGADGVTIQGTGAGTGLWLSVGGDTVTNVTLNLFSSFQIECQGNGSTIEDDKVGTDDTGTTPLGGGQGIVVQGNSNLIKDNVMSGLYNYTPRSSSTALTVNGNNNTIEGNDIGTDISGTINLGDGGDGIDLNGSSNTVGGTASGDANVISGLNGSFGAGISIQNGSTNLLEGNFIGTDVSGTKLLGNGTMSDQYGYFGISIIGGGHNTIGGTTSAAANVISGNSSDGMYLSSFSPAAESIDNVIEGNFIGTDIKGTASGFGNGGSGVDISESSYDTVGGTTSAAANVISDNGISSNPQQTAGGTDGIRIEFSGSHNVVEGNLIGTDITGTAGLGNTGYGVEMLTAAASNVIGGQSTVDRNIISANDLGGVNIDGVGTNANVVAGDFIGVDSSGGTGLGNTGPGVTIADGASSNTLGGTANGAANVISANTLYGVAISGKGTSHNVVEGNRIGTDINGIAALGNGSNGSLQGVIIDTGASSNTIGGTSAGARNIISGNAGGGVTIVATTGSTTTANVVDGNYIGTEINGTTALANNAAGVVLDGGSSNGVLTSNTIGGTTAAAGNLISGNNGNGVEMLGTHTTLNVVEGNLIGTAAGGATALPNTGNGVEIHAGASANTIGGAVAGDLNVISGNTNDGVLIEDSGTTKNVVTHDFIGVDLQGNAILANTANGVALANGAASNTIGGLTAQAANILSGNGHEGIFIDGSGTSHNLVEGNDIGTTATSLTGLGNADNGVEIDNGAASNTIGGSTASARDVIAGNATNGIYITDSGTNNNLVEGNDIGTTPTSQTGLGNTANGVDIDNGAASNTIGGSTAAVRNVISGNGTNGIDITGSGTNNNVVAGNYIGTNLAGSGRLGNTSAGVSIDNGAASNTLGGTVAGAANVISANGTQGISIAVGGTTGNLVEGNFIGTNALGSAALGNNGVGILVGDTSANTTIGGTTATARNIISGNAGDGIDIHSNSGALTGVLVEGNYIGTNALGTAAVPNGGAGVNLGTNASADVVGGTGLARNVISGNMLQGVVMDQGATGNLVKGNDIGTNAAGTAGVPNQQDGVDIGFGSAASGNTVGPANIIAYNKGVGVNVVSGSGDLITQNSIFANTTLGIQVAGGANNNLSPPSLTSATFSGGQLTLVGTVAGQASANLTLELFVASQGQGKTFVISVGITTDGNGNFTAKVTKSFAVGLILTATVTDGSNDTSPFAPVSVTVKA